MEVHVRILQPLLKMVNANGYFVPKSLQTQKIVTWHMVIQLRYVTSYFTSLVFSVYHVLENLKYILKVIVDGLHCFYPCTPPGFRLYLTTTGMAFLSFSQHCVQQENM